MSIILLAWLAPCSAQTMLKYSCPLLPEAEYFYGQKITGEQGETWRVSFWPLTKEKFELRQTFSIKNWLGSTSGQEWYDPDLVSQFWCQAAPFEGAIYEVHLKLVFKPSRTCTDLMEDDRTYSIFCRDTLTEAEKPMLKIRYLSRQRSNNQSESNSTSWLYDNL